MQRLSKYKADLIIVVGFLILPFLLFGDVSLGSRTMLPVDNLFQWAPWSDAAAEMGVQHPQNSLLTDLIVENYAWKRFIQNSIHNREIPLWNPYLFAGVPFLATGQQAAYYPFSALFLLLPLAKAYGWYTISQLWLAGVAMYLFGRILKMRRGSALLAGLVYQGSGFILVSAAVFPMVLGAAVWLPLLLASIEKVIHYSAESGGLRIGRTLLWVASGSTSLCVQILAGHIEITYYTLLIMAVYAGWRLVGLWLRRRSLAGMVKPGGWLLSMVALGLLLGSVQLVPFYEIGKVNFREGAASFEEVQGWAFPKRRLLTLAAPNFFGNPSHHSYWDVFSGEEVSFGSNYYGQLNSRGNHTSDWGIKNYVEGGIYLGILPMLLAALGLAAWRAGGSLRRAHTAFFAVLSFFSLGFIFGTPLYALLYYGLPFINQLHTPFRWIFPLSLCAAALAGFGADYLAETRRQVQADAKGDAGIEKAGAWASDQNAPSWLRPLFLWGKPSVISGLAAAVFYAGSLLLMGLLASRLLYPQIEPLVERLFLGMAQAADAFPSARAFYSYEFRQMFLLGLMLLAAGVVLRASRFLIRVAGRPIWLYMAAAAIILDLVVANYGFHAAVDPALLDYKPEMVKWLEQQPGQWRLTSFNPRGDKPFNANSGWLFDFQDVRGYDSIIPKQYTEYMGAIEPQYELAFNRIQPISNWESLNSPLLDVLTVKYIITAESLALPKLVEVWTGEGVRIYENLAAAPRAYALPQSSTVIVDDAIESLTQWDPRQYVLVEKEALSPGHPLLSGTRPQPSSNSLKPASIDEYRGLQVVASVEVSDPSWLLLNDSYFPGWKAFVRPYGTGEDLEREVDITLVNGNFRGVLLDPGQWSVRFRYSPRSFQLGGLASFMGAVVLIFAVGVWVWRRMVNPDAEMTNTRSIAKNSVAPVVLNLFNRAIDFVFAAFYLRVLGPAAAGSFATAIATAGIFEIVSNYGLDILLMREVSQDKSKASYYLLNTSILRLGAAVVASLPVLVMVFGSGYVSNPLSEGEILAIGLIMVGMVFSGMSKGVDRLFYAYEKAEIPAAMTVVTTMLKVGLGVAALLMGYGFVGLAAVSIITNIVTLAILVILALRSFTLPGPWQVDWGLQRRMIRLGYPLMLIHLLQTVFISIDVFLLRFMLDNGDEVVGWYNSAYKWFNALQIVPSFFTLALFPIIAREIKQSLESAWRMYQMSIKLMLLLALPMAVATSYIAFPLVKLLAGDEFLPHGAVALQIVIWSIPIGWLNSVTNYVLIGLGMEKMQPRAFAAAVIFNIGANLLLIPRFSYVAASVTTILSELILLVMFDYYMRKRMPGMNWIGFVWRPVLVAGAMVLAMLLGQQIHTLLGLVLGIAVYPTGLWLLRVFGEDERKILRSILPASLSRRLRLI